MKWIHKKIVKITDKISRFFKGLFAIGGTLIGIKKTDTDAYDLKQLYVAGILIMTLTPFGILFFQSAFSLGTLISIILALLCLVNLDRTLLLISLFAEAGVNETLSTFFEPYISGSESTI